VNRKKALARLPEAHAQALRLRDRGLDDEAIGKSLGIPPEAVGPLLWVAEVKLAQLPSDTRPKP
jgi:DNA-directed RNA polymerase specialized sigma24 family protein